MRSVLCWKGFVPVGPNRVAVYRKTAGCSEENILPVRNFIASKGHAQKLDGAGRSVSRYFI